MYTYTTDDLRHAYNCIYLMLARKADMLSFTYGRIIAFYRFITKKLRQLIAAEKYCIQVFAMMYFVL